MSNQSYTDLFFGSFSGYWEYLKSEVLFSYTYKPWYQNYFYWLIIISLLFWSLEIFFPWRKNQSIFRKDFGLDAFYMFFNFFILSLIGYAAISNVAVQFFHDGLHSMGINNNLAVEINGLPMGLKIVFAFILRDFIQWCTHIMLHRVTWLWEFHKVHHSVKEMGFAAHLRFHWMEKFIYNFIMYVPMAVLGFGIEEFFAAHIIAIAIGHFNHANVNVPLGPLKYVLNNPQMHIWHHARKQPNKYGSNFGLSLSIWDYLFKTAYVPASGRDIELGFEQDEEFPEKAGSQLIWPLGKRKRK